MNLVLRDQNWLEQQFLLVWERGFKDLIPANRLVIRFGRVARTRLGSIRMSRDRKTSTILVNRLFQKENVPIEVLEVTIAHELSHYLHGFSSPFEQKFSSPHAGGVVTKELKKRGFGPHLIFQKYWVKRYWRELFQQHRPFSIKTLKRSRRISSCSWRRLLRPLFY